MDVQIAEECAALGIVRDTGQLGPHHWDQLYLKHIRYVDHGDGVGATDYLISVTLLYEDRPDPFSNYRAGFEIRTRRRCTHIEVHTDADEALLTRRYHLEYLDQLADDAGGALPPNGASLLSRVRVVGHDGERTEELPALDFRYAPFEPGRKDLMPLGGRDLPAQSLGAADLELVDLFGNGLPDLLQMNGSVRFWRNRGDGAFDLPRPMRDAPAGLQLADPGVQLIDADGDGRTDLLVTKPQISGYFPQRFGGLWDRRSFQKHAFAPSFDLEDPEVRLIDLDGDGVTDAIRSGSRLECFFNDPKEGWNRIRTLERRDLDEFPNVSFADSRIRFADLSGDGLQDIVMIHSGNVYYWPNLGHGDWGSRIAMRNSPRLPVDYDPRRILIGDIDGDGLDDIVYVDHCRLLLFINQSGNGWSDPIEIEGTPGITDVDSVRLADMLGTGISGVLWSSERSETGRANLFFLDFAGDNNPYVLREMNNNSLQLAEGAEQDCHDQGGKGNSGDKLRGILCITPGASRASGFVVGWHDLEDPNRGFKVRLRNDQWVNVGADNIMITRCCDAGTCALSPPQCDPVPDLLDLGGEDLDFSWVYSAQAGAAKAQVSSSTIKGKPKTTVLGVVEMPTAFVVFLQPDPQLPPLP